MINYKLLIYKKITIALFLLLFFIFVSGYILRSELLYAKNIELKGVVQNIIWESSNHKLSEFKIRNEEGDEIKLSHFSIALKVGDVSVGDIIFKQKGSEYCLINNNVTRFTKFEIKDTRLYIFQQSNGELVSFF